MGVLSEVVRNWVLPIAAGLTLWAVTQQLFGKRGLQPEDALAPDFHLKDTDGHDVRLSSLRGKPVLLNFWGTWCGPCRAELPTINRFAAAHPEVAVVGVAVDSGSWKQLAAAKRDMGITFAVWEGSSAVQGEYGIRTVPTSYWIDAEGVIRASHKGIVTAGTLERWAR